MLTLTLREIETGAMILYWLWTEPTVQAGGDGKANAAVIDHPDAPERKMCVELDREVVLEFLVPKQEIARCGKR